MVASIRSAGAWFRERPPSRKEARPVAAQYDDAKPGCLPLPERPRWPLSENFTLLKDGAGSCPWERAQGSPDDGISGSGRHVVLHAMRRTGMTSRRV